MARRTRTVRAGGHVIEVEVSELIPPLPPTCSICGGELVEAVGFVPPADKVLLRCPGGHGMMQVDAEGR
jgi:hypothetical protein